MPKLIPYKDLTVPQEWEVKSAFIYWWKDPSVKTFQEWAYQHAFYIKADGHLAKKPSYAEPIYMVGEVANGHVVK